MKNLKEKVIEVIEGLKDQQAMSDDSFDPLVEQVLEELKNERVKITKKALPRKRKKVEGSSELSKAFKVLLPETDEKTFFSEWEKVIKGKI